MNEKIINIILKLRLIEAIKFCNYIQKNFSKCNMGSTKNENNYKNLDIKYL